MQSLVASVLISGAVGHGYMTKPTSRASLGCHRSYNPYFCEAHQATDYACENLPCGECKPPRWDGSGGNCTAGHYPGYAIVKEPYCNPNQMSGTAFLETPGEIQANWTAGDTVEVAWVVSAPHGGHYQFRLCLDGTDTEECFKKTPLPFADGSMWKPLVSPCTDCTQTDTPYGLAVPVKTDKVVLPKNIQCERCTLGWRWDVTVYESTVFTGCSDVSIIRRKSSFLNRKK